MKRRYKILFFAEAVTLAHVTRPLVLAQSLDPEQFEIHFSCAQDYEYLLEKTSFTYHRIDSIPSKQFIHALANGSRVYNYGNLSAYLEDDLQAIDAAKPDLILGDFRLSLSVSSKLRNIPYINIINAHWSPFSISAFPLPEHPMIHFFGVTLSNAIFQLVRPAVFFYHSLPLNKLRKKQGLPSLGNDLRKVYTQGDHVLYTDTPQLVPTAANLPNNHHYIGPILWSPEIPFPSWWKDLDDHKPIIYVTLGSSGKSELLPDIIAALEKLPVIAMIATAGRIKLDVIPENIYTANYLPGLAAAHKASVVICSGGSATAYQALSTGTPVLGIAANMDQYLTMNAICRNNAGRLIGAGQANTSAVTERLKEILEDQTISDAAGKIADQFTKYNAEERFKTFLKTILQ